jgi:hypothetical protein
MKLSKPVKIIIGILTLFVVLYPFVIMPAFMFFFMFNFTIPVLETSAVPTIEMIDSFFPLMMAFYPLMMCFSGIQLGLQIFYIIHIIKHKALEDTFRILFAIGSFMMPYVAMPIYFIVYLWKEPLEVTLTMEKNTNDAT